jgi:radical SAM superfamily enzyme YgiQ (UPF0313 family)
VIPPLGLLCIAGPISERYGRANVRLVDMNVRPLTDDDLRWADDVYLSAMLMQSESFDEVAARAKALGKTTIAGGPCVHEGTAHLDYAIIDECELTLEAFLNELFHGQPARVQRGQRPASGEFFLPDFSWVDCNQYTSMALQFSRGCPHDCESCDITSRYGRSMRTKEVRVFLQELQHLYEIGWRGSVFVIDDNFIGKPRAALELARALVEWQQEHHYPFEFFTQATVLLAEQRNQELLETLYPAGFSMVFLGIETPNEASLKETNKHFNLGTGMTLVEKIQKIQKEGQVHVMGGFIVGFDSDTPDVFARQARFIVEELQLPTAMVGILEPLPETKLERRLRREGRMVGRAHGTIAGRCNVAFEPKNLTREQLRAGYIGLIKLLYLDTGGFYERCLQSMEHVGRPLFQGIYTRDIIIGVVRLLVAEGVKSQFRWPFWKLLFRVLVRFPDKIPYALRWAGYGLHYRMLTEQMLELEEADAASTTSPAGVDAASSAAWVVPNERVPTRARPMDAITS